MIYIIGIEHQIQTTKAGGDYKETEYFKFLKEQISEKNISILAEEFSVEAENEAPGESILKIISEELKLKHIYADPDRSERKELGIKLIEELRKEHASERDKMTEHKWHWKILGEMAQYLCLREKEWLKRIEQYLESNILFVCGYQHCEGFKVLLNENGQKSKILKIII